MLLKFLAPNQAVIDTGDSETFVSYGTNIARRSSHDGSIQLDEEHWNYSKTTSKYHAIFLGETTKETEAKIKTGIYLLTNLN